MPKMQVTMAESKILREIRRMTADARRSGQDLDPEELAEAVVFALSDPEKNAAKISAASEDAKADREAEAAEVAAAEAAAVSEAAVAKARKTREAAEARRARGSRPAPAAVIPTPPSAPAAVAPVPAAAIEPTPPPVRPVTDEPFGGGQPEPGDDVEAPGPDTAAE